MRFWPALVLATGLMAEELAPIGIVRGALAGCDATHLTIRDEDNNIFKFVTDARTFIERDHQRVTCSKLSDGNRMEIVSDRSSEPGSRYARLVRVVGFESRPRPRTVILPRAPIPYYDPTVRFAPRGNLTFSGIILRSERAGLLLRTRLNGEKWILVRRDTHYCEDGLPVELSSLLSNTRVFVRAGTNLDGEVEAYEVVWGDILSPTGSR